MTFEEIKSTLESQLKEKGYTVSVVGEGEFPKRRDTVKCLPHNTDESVLCTGCDTIIVLKNDVPKFTQAVIDKTVESCTAHLARRVTQEAHRRLDHPPTHPSPSSSTPAKPQ